MGSAVDSKPVRYPGSRFVLRQGAQEWCLSQGVALVGSGPACVIAVQHESVAPLHARLVVDARGLTVTDLESRSGVLVNGTRIAGQTALVSGDRVAFGQAVFEVLVEQIVDDDGDRPTLLEDPTTLRPPSGSQGTESFGMIGGVIDKAVAMGRAGEIAAAVSNLFSRLAEDCEHRRGVTQDAVDTAGRYAVKLAAATGDGFWVNVLLRIHLARNQLLPIDLIDALYELLRRIQGVDWELLGRYVDQMRQRTQTMGPTGRFSGKRIEGLLQFGPG